MPRPSKAHGGRRDAEDDLSPRKTKAEAEAQWEIVADALREKQPKLSELMDASRDDVLAYMTFPRGTLDTDRLDQSARTG